MSFLCLFVQVSCITSFLRGGHKSLFGLLMKPAAISILWAFGIIILCLCSPKKLTELNWRRFNAAAMLLGFCVNHFSSLVQNKIKVGQVNRLVSTGCPLKIFDSSLSASVLCIIGTFFDMFTANDDFGHLAEFWTFFDRNNYYLFYSRFSNE